jgi:hypothetical protein
MRATRKRKENNEKIYKTTTVEISPYTLEYHVSQNIEKFVSIPEGFSNENISVDFENEVDWNGSVDSRFIATFRRLETDEEYTERIENIKKEEEKNKVAHEKRRKTAEANKEKKERELFEQLKAKYESP